MTIEALKHRTPAVADGLPPAVAAGLLARTALALANRRMGGREPPCYLEGEEELRARIVDEIRSRVGLSLDDHSPEALLSIEDAIDEETEQFADPVDYDAAFSRLETSEFVKEQYVGAAELQSGQVPGHLSAQPSTEHHFKALQQVLREETREPPVIGSWTALLDYLQIALPHEPIEQFRVLFLDRKNILIRDEVQQRGTVDRMTLHLRKIVKRALELGASAIITVHNDPSGDQNPSRADIEMTKQVVQALGAVGITVHDHVIVGKNRHTSFKSQRLI
jgi:DNA repair protein RadC